MRRMLDGLIVLALLLGTFPATAAESSLPAWAADPLTYNSCTDDFRDNHALLVKNRVYYAEGMLHLGTLIMTAEVGRPETSKVLCHLETPDFNVRNHFFDMGNGFLLIEVNSGIVYSLSYDGSDLKPLFTLEDPDPGFSILVGHDLYCNQGNQVVSFDLSCGKRRLIYELPEAAGGLGPLDWNAEYAEGYLFVRAENIGFYSIRVQSGEVYSLDDVLANDFGADRQMLVLNGRVYANGRGLGLCSVDYHGLNPEKVCDYGMNDFLHASGNAVLLRDEYIGSGVDMLFFNPDGPITAFDPNRLPCVLSPTTNRSSFMLGNRLYGVTYEKGVMAEGVPYAMDCYNSIPVEDLLKQSVITSYPALWASGVSDLALVYDLLEHLPVY